MAEPAILQIDKLSRVHRAGWLSRGRGFSLYADFRVEAAAIVAVIGVNGAGKSSLFDLISGDDVPTAGRVLCRGQDIHRVKRDERPRLVRYNRQTQYLRHRKARFPPGFLLEPARGSGAQVHLFDEPNGADWMTPMFFDTALRLRGQGHVVLLAMHPRNVKELGMLRGICDRFIFAQQGEYLHFDTFDALAEHPLAQAYFAPLVA